MPSKSMTELAVTGELLKTCEASGRSGPGVLQITDLPSESRHVLGKLVNVCSVALD
eukprot:NODE_9544_length_1416_cov_6.710628.p7 GENE.NODE_9544_length_1416_cov_6.710628~~NODE_9544_length_1416_cov_6.710628.p7  ORF type:complete len:56 (+),score=7.34 NODE_9544_length_1416_cov_6.710628:605-772(+)